MSPKIPTAMPPGAKSPGAKTAPEETAARSASGQSPAEAAAGNRPTTAAPAAAGLDDMVMPFAIEGADVRGRIARLGPVIDEILNRHGYPLPVARLLGEALVLAAMLGTALKLEGRFTIQTSSDGPVDFLVADMTAQGGLRGYAHFDAARVAALEDQTHPALADILGKGHLALTIDQGPGRKTYQGVVPIEGETLAQCGEAYFARSEQLPTRIHLVVAQTQAPGAPGGWRAGGLMIQHMPADGGRARDIAPGDVPEGMAAPAGGAADAEDHDEPWSRAGILMETLEDHELVDPDLAPERVLYRLYHEDGVRAFDAHRLSFSCHCSRTYVTRLLNSFGREEMADMVTEDGTIEVRCEFCNESYSFDPSELASE